MIAFSLAAAAVCAGANNVEIEKKISYVEGLLGDELAAQRIAANEAARREHEAARRLLGRAREQLQAGDAEAGLRAADDALRAALAARRLAPDARRLAAEENARYERELESAGMLADALERYAAGATLDYTARFSSPEQAYRHELERHRSLRGLVPLALDTLHPEPAAQALVERYLAASGRLQAAAERSAAREDHASALDQLAEATAFLQRALSATGVSYPR